MLKDTITVSDIDILRQMDEGWQDIWKRVIEKLLGDGTDGPLCLQASKVCRTPRGSRSSVAICEASESPTDEDKEETSNEDSSARRAFSRGAPSVLPEELISYVYEYYDRRLKKGTLLTNFEVASPETAESDLITYLCSSSYLSRLLKDCRRKNHLRYKQTDLEVYRNYADSFNEGRFIEENRTFEALRKETSAVFSRLRPSCGPRFSVIDLHAGLQLYPRLDEESENNRQLQEGVHQTLPEVPGRPPTERIRAEHQAVANTYDEELDQIREKIIERNTNPRKWQKRTDELTEKYDAKYFESIFIPLERGSLARLTGKNTDTAYQHRHRYREKLPEYFPDLLEHYRQLREMRAERGEKIERWSDVEKD